MAFSVGRAPDLSQYLLLCGLLCLRRLLLLLALLLAFFRGALGRSPRLLGCLRGHALGRGWRLVVLLLESRSLPLLLLPLLPLLLLLLEGALTL